MSNGLCVTSADISDATAEYRFIWMQRCNKAARRLYNAQKTIDISHNNIHGFISHMHRFQKNSFLNYFLTANARQSGPSTGNHSDCIFVVTV